MKEYKYGKDLIFISRIARDGSEVIPCQGDMSYLDNDTFEITSLSLTYKTMIASEMNVYVVKLKETDAIKQNTVK